MDVESELKKLKYHISRLSKVCEDPLTSLIIEYDLSETDVEEIHEIFSNYSSLVKPNWDDFETELLSHKIEDPHKLVTIFRRCGSWLNICRRYAAERIDS